MAKKNTRSKINPIQIPTGDYMKMKSLFREALEIGPLDQARLFEEVQRLCGTKRPQALASVPSTSILVFKNSLSDLVGTGEIKKSGNRGRSTVYSLVGNDGEIADRPKASAASANWAVLQACAHSPISTEELRDSAAHAMASSGNRDKLVSDAIKAMQAKGLISSTGGIFGITADGKRLLSNLPKGAMEVPTTAIAGMLDVIERQDAGRDADALSAFAKQLQAGPIGRNEAIRAAAAALDMTAKEMLAVVGGAISALEKDGLLSYNAVSKKMDPSKPLMRAAARLADGSAAITSVPELISLAKDQDPDEQQKADDEPVGMEDGNALDSGAVLDAAIDEQLTIPPAAGKVAYDDPNPFDGVYVRKEGGTYTVLQLKSVKDGLFETRLLETQGALMMLDPVERLCLLAKTGLLDADTGRISSRSPEAVGSTPSAAATRSVLRALGAGPVAAGCLMAGIDIPGFEAVTDEMSAEEVAAWLEGAGYSDLAACFQTKMPEEGLQALLESPTDLGFKGEWLCRRIAKADCPDWLAKRLPTAIRMQWDADEAAQIEFQANPFGGDDAKMRAVMFDQEEGIDVSEMEAVTIARALALAYRSALSQEAA